MLDPSRLRHRLIAQRPVRTQDQNTGAMNITSWENVATLWAAIEPISAREMIAAQSEDSKITTRIVIRYNSGITDEMRLFHEFKNVYYDIHGILADKDSGLEYLTLPCSQGLKY